MTETEIIAVLKSVSNKKYWSYDYHVILQAISESKSNTDMHLALVDITSTRLSLIRYEGDLYSAEYTCAENIKFLAVDKLIELSGLGYETIIKKAMGDSEWLNTKISERIEEYKIHEFFDGALGDYMPDAGKNIITGMEKIKEIINNI